MAAEPQTRSRMPWPAILALLALPLLLFADSFGRGRHFLPFDLAEFPPLSTTLPAEQLAAIQQGANYDATEPLVWFLPELELTRQALARDQYPHWNPLVRGGAPLTAHGHIGHFNPLHWPAFFFADPVDGLLYLSCAMVALAGLLMFGLLRELGLGVPAALAGAVAFAWSGTMSANGHWYQRMEPIALLPGMLWAMVAMAQRTERAVPAIGLALALWACWTAGFPPFAIPVTLLAALAGALLVMQALGRDGMRSARPLFLWMAAGGVLGMLLAAPQVVQQLSFYPESNRTPDPGDAALSAATFDPMGLLGFLMPTVFGHPGDRMLPPGPSSPLTWLLGSRLDWTTGLLAKPNYNFTEYAVFPGAAALLLACTGLFARGARWRWLAFLVFVLLVLLAVAPPWMRWFHAFGLVRPVPPMRYAALGCVPLAMLAAHGFHVLWQQLATKAARTAAGFGAGLGLLLLSALLVVPAEPPQPDPWPQQIADQYRHVAPEFDAKPEDVTAAMLSQALFRAPRETDNDRLALARRQLRTNLLTGGAGLLLASVLLVLASSQLRSPAVRRGALTALALLGAGQLWHFGHGLNEGRELPVAWDSPVHRFLRDQRDATSAQGGFMVARADRAGELWLLPPGSLARDGIRDFQFYTFLDGYSGRLVRKLYGNAFFHRDHMVKSLPDDERLKLPLWDAMGLRYLLARHELVHGGTPVGPRLSGPGGEFVVHERASALPRAWMVPAVAEVAGEDAAIDAMLSPAFRPQEAVILTQAEVARVPAAQRPAADPATSQRTVRFVEEDSKRLALRVPAGAPGWLVVSDTAMTGWSVEVNGKAAPILRGNVYQRVVPLPAEACEVVFRYTTPGFVGGLGLGALGLAGLAVLAVVALQRARARRTMAT